MVRKISRASQKRIDRIQRETEDRIEALITASQITIDEDTKKDLAKRINGLNLYYEQRYGKPYQSNSSRYE